MNPIKNTSGNISILVGVVSLIVAIGGGGATWGVLSQQVSAGERKTDIVEAEIKVISSVVTRHDTTLNLVEKRLERIDDKLEKVLQEVRKQ